MRTKWFNFLTVHTYGRKVDNIMSSCVSRLWRRTPMLLEAFTILAVNTALVVLCAYHGIVYIELTNHGCACIWSDADRLSILNDNRVRLVSVRDSPRRRKLFRSAAVLRNGHQQVRQKPSNSKTRGNLILRARLFTIACRSFVQRFPRVVQEDCSVSTDYTTSFRILFRKAS